MAEFTQEQIRNFWEQQADRHRHSPAASWSDKPVIDMEVREILRYLEDGDSVLDVGCANGYCTLIYAAQKKINIHGLDVVPKMIELARERYEQVKDELKGAASFDTADILSLDIPDNQYGKVLIKRVITNLDRHEQQLRGICECLRVLKPGGLLVMADATQQGWRNMNRFRTEWQLPEIPMPKFNTYLDREKVVDELANEVQPVEIKNFSSTYYVGTRILKPLLVKALGADIDIAAPGMEWNRFFSQLPACGDYGTQELFVFKKKQQ